MEKTPKTLILIIGIIVLAVIANRFYQYQIKQNFLLEVNTFCDPVTESCFVSDCSLEDDPECDLTPYKKVEVLAAGVPQCLQEHTCQSFSCDGLEQCSITYCSDETKEGGEGCINNNTE